jgi:hypothetical protein
VSWDARTRRSGTGSGRSFGNPGLCGLLCAPVLDICSRHRCVGFEGRSTPYSISRKSSLSLSSIVFLGYSSGDIFLRGDKHDEAAEYLDRNCGYSRLRIEATLSRFNGF